MYVSRCVCVCVYLRCWLLLLDSSLCLFPGGLRIYGLLGLKAKGICGICGLQMATVEQHAPCLRASFRDFRTRIGFGGT